MRKRSRAWVVLVGIGLACILGAGGLAYWNVQDAERAGTESAAAAAMLMSRVEAVRDEAARNDVEVIPDYELNPDAEMPVVEMGVGSYVGMLYFPEWNLYLPVGYECTEAGLRGGPCLYVGNVYRDDCVIAGHNYYCQFGRLTTVRVGMPVVFTDMAGSEFRYMVGSVETIDGYDVDGMFAGDWDLTLFTCTLSGTERVCVRCVRDGGTAA